MHRLGFGHIGALGDDASFYDQRADLYGLHQCVCFPQRENGVAGGFKHGPLGPV